MDSDDNKEQKTKKAKRIQRNGIVSRTKQNQNGTKEEEKQNWSIRKTKQNIE